MLNTSRASRMFWCGFTRGESNQGNLIKGKATSPIRYANIHNWWSYFHFRFLADVLNIQ